MAKLILQLSSPEPDGNRQEKSPFDHPTHPNHPNQQRKRGNKKFQKIGMRLVRRGPGAYDHNKENFGVMFVKARYTVISCSQTAGVDYGDVYSLVMKFPATRMHYDIEHHATKETVENEILEIEWCSIEDQAAEKLTKLTVGAKFTRQRETIMGPNNLQRYFGTVVPRGL
jgi:hypothetical protein